MARRRHRLAHEAHVDGALDRAAPRPPPARAEAGGLHPGGYSRRGQAITPGRRPTTRCRILLDHSPRRRRGLDPDAPHVPARARRLPRRPGARRRGGAAPLRARRRSTSSCSTSCSRGSTGSRSAGGSAPRAPCRSSCSRPATTSSTRCSGSSSARTTTSRSRSRSASSAAACGRCCAALRRPHVAGRRDEVIDRGDVVIDLPRRTVEVRGEPVAADVRRVRAACRCSRRSPASCSGAGSSSSGSAGAPTTASRARSTSTSATCARRSSATRGSPS